MASLDDLKKRITSVKSTQKITKAMKMVAAAKLKRAQDSAEKGRPYSEKMNNIILNLSSGISDKEAAPKLLSGSGKEQVHLCVVLTSDRGLCGGFNANIIKNKDKLSLKGSILICNPVPKKYSIPNKIIEKAINSSMLKARQNKIHGKKLTPFLLEKVSSITKGKTLETNIQLMLNNAKLAARIAFALNK